MLSSTPTGLGLAPRGHLAFWDLDLHLKPEESSQSLPVPGKAAVWDVTFQLSALQLSILLREGFTYLLGLEFFPLPKGG